MYKNYLHKKDRGHVIKNFLNRNNLTDFRIIKKNEKVDSLKSDFDVVQVFCYFVLYHIQLKIYAINCLFNERSI